ncbi:hypothetical protein S7711_02787 [Stachybotrys chartarum IBT 7711]|uniref:CSC1/OSCA1-like 7TM region domain-containing protein n=1 Tax=Stachybotrys chartarum (strain CBS 109288 / IBT 7711) TaxID=1280523 RepID=A0A084ALZ8_STACB|nr:hypothetical protein S7711_02787 [Stachybotrys chartarum IBT 7711]KFA49848.1 hypothetical protein S40293_01239 [Stachybotrys chartarum IBT 40293]KFA71383.1 hypothetical protein S40288_09166 [Stachybotrys chartarum IBT 40288]
MGSFISWIETNLPQGSAEATGQGEATDEPPASVSGMLATLFPVLLISLVYILFFLIFRRSQRRYYAPRTYLGSLREQERSPSMPSGFFNWIGAFWKIPDVYALQHQNIDSYLFLRFLRVCTAICFVSMCITWPILFPVNITGGGGQEQLEILSYANVDIENDPNRLYAHTFVAWLVYGFVMYTIMRECIFYINLRQAFLLSPQYANRISSRTVLFTSVPEEYLDEARIRQIFAGSVKHVWIAGDSNPVDDIVEERDEVAMKLEKAEIKLIKAVNKKRIKAGVQNDGPRAPHDPERGDIAAQWITPKERPSHRLGPLGLVGRKVDTIEWGRSELHRILPQSETAQADWRAGNFKKVSSVFVEFHTQSDAQAAFQVVTHHHALRMAPKYIGVKPSEVVWKSLSIPWWQLIVRRYAIYAFIAILIIFWAIPVGIVGIISQVSTLQQLPGLTWIADIPDDFLGVISGLLPAVALSILMSLVPVIMRACAKFSGAVSLSQVELFTQNAYFVFQVVQVFLIRTLTDSASRVIVSIVDNPGSVFSMLSSSIPTSSNFYISYFIVQGITIAVAVLTQAVGLVIFKLMYTFLSSTPRSMYKRWTTLSAISWGSVLPVYTCIVVISITYSVIAPLMLFWSTLGLALFYLAYRYNILFVTDNQIDTRGLIYPRALKQLFVGVYLAEVAMIGMFAVSASPGPAVLMAAFLIFTVLFHITMAKALNPLMYGLPRSLNMEEEAYQAGSGGSNELGLDGVATNSRSKDLKSKLTGRLAPGGNNAGVQKKGNFFMRWLKPWNYADYATLRSLVPQGEHMDLAYQYSEGVEADAYYPPSVTSQVPILWIPEDAAGVSKQEVAMTSKVIPISDEGCSLNEKNKIVWDMEGARPPIWNEKIYY